MLILAGNHLEADAYTKTAHYLGCTNDIRGYKDTTLLLVGSWHDRQNIDISFIETYCKSHNITIRDTNTLTDTERRIVESTYQLHKHDFLCPHTTNPKQITSVCRRCVTLEIIGATIYQLPKPLREYPNAWCASVANTISSPFKSRNAAENWAIEEWIHTTTNSQG